MLKLFKDEINNEHSASVISLIQDRCKVKGQDCTSDTTVSPVTSHFKKCISLLTLNVDSSRTTNYKPAEIPNAVSRRMKTDWFKATDKM